MLSASAVFDQLRIMGVLKDESHKNSAPHPLDESDRKLSVSQSNWEPGSVSSSTDSDSDASSDWDRGRKRVKLKETPSPKRKRSPAPDRLKKTDGGCNRVKKIPSHRPLNRPMVGPLDLEISADTSDSPAHYITGEETSSAPHPLELESDTELSVSQSDWEPGSVSSSTDSDSDASSDWDRGRKRVKLKETPSPKRKRSPAPDRLKKTDRGRKWVKETTSRKRSCAPARQKKMLNFECDYEYVADSESDSDGSVQYPALISHCPDPKVQVAAAKQKEPPKKHCCKFCEKLVTKISKHAQNVHGSEAEVARILSMEKNTKERREAWVQLTKDGDYSHNYKVLKDKRGVLIPKYRTMMQKKVDNEYIACPFCKGLYTKQYLSDHIVRCTSKPDNARNNPRSMRRVGELLLPIPYDVTSSFYSNVLSRMNKDDVFSCITSDPLILGFGERMYSRKDVEENTPNQVSSRLREIGRLLKVLRQESQMRVKTISVAMEPANFDLLVHCIRKLGEYDDSTHLYGKASLALRLGYSLKKCSQIKKSRAVRENDDAAEKEAERFDSLMTGDWYDTISASAGQSVERAKFNKPKLVPACADVQKVHTLLQQKTSSSDYSVLAKTTLCLVSLFNRKRGGEVQRMKVDDFEKGMVSSSRVHDPEIAKGFTATENKLINVLDRVEIRGKFNRRVAILLTKEMVCLIRQVLDLRKMLPGLVEASKYIFATPNGERPFRGSDVIREFAIEAGVSDLALFTATNLRKQIATLAQSMTLSEWEQDHLATFLGHDIRVHRSVYRQPLDLLEKAKVAKVLMAVNGGMKPILGDSVSVDENEDLDNNMVPTRSETGGRDQPPGCEGGFEDGSDPESDGEREDQGNRATGGVVIAEEAVPVAASSRGSRTSKRRAWSLAETSAVRRQLKQCIQLNRVPQKEEAELAIAREPDLQTRTWRNVKDFVYNMVKKCKVQRVYREHPT